MSNMEEYTPSPTLDPSPNSLDPLLPVYRNGLIVITIFAMMSLLSVTALLVFITNRLISWRKHYKEYVGYVLHSGLHCALVNPD